MGPSFMSCTEESHATPQNSMAVFVELGQTLTEKKKKGRPNNQPYPISKLSSSHSSLNSTQLSSTHLREE